MRDWRVAVVYGGVSAEDSLYMASKPKSEWSVHDVVGGLSGVTAEAVWLDPTRPDFVDRVRRFDAAFLNVHGEFGEDGNLQGLLAYLGVPYTGSGVLTSAVGADKRVTKLVLSSSGVAAPAHRRVRPGDVAGVSAPVMVKAVNGGSSVGMELVVDTADVAGVVDRLHGGGFTDLIVESFVEGVPVTVPALKIGGDVVLLPPVLCISEREYYDEYSKLCGEEAGSVRYDTVTDVADPRLRVLHDATRAVLDEIDFEGAIRVDFVLSENGEPVLLELNTLPGVQRGSNLVLSAEAAGISYESLLAVVLASSANGTKLVPWLRKSLVAK